MTKVKRLWYHITDDHTVVPAESFTFQPIDQRRVALTEVHGYTVSTVFTGIDQSRGEIEPPVVFETLVKRDDEESYKYYATWSEALEGHQATVKDIEDAIQG